MAFPRGLWDASPDKRDCAHEGKSFGEAGMDLLRQNAWTGRWYSDRRGCGLLSTPTGSICGDDDPWLRSAQIVCPPSSSGCWDAQQEMGCWHVPVTSVGITAQGYYLLALLCFSLPYGPVPSSMHSSSGNALTLRRYSKGTGFMPYHAASWWFAFCSSLSLAAELYSF